MRLLALMIAMGVISATAHAQELVQVCTNCKGLGTTTCTLCQGKGKWRAKIGGKSQKIECPSCKGTKLQPCWLCDGTGKQMEMPEPATRTDHPEGYFWSWCTSCGKAGVCCCPNCNGLGVVYESDGHPNACALCNGRKQVLCNTCKGTCGGYVMRLKCEICEGNGTLTCSKCNGKGWLPPEHVDDAFAEVCKSCEGRGLVSHKDCEGKGCENCKDGKVKCRKCDGRGAVIVTPEPKYRNCTSCYHKGVQNCRTCRGKGYREVSEDGIEK